METPKETRLRRPMRERAWRVAAAVLVGWVCGCVRLPAHAPLPEADRPLPDSLRREAVVVLAESTAFQVTVQGSGNLLERRNVAWYRVNRRNPQQLETLVFYEHENLQKPAQIRVDAFFPGRAPWTATRSAFKSERIRPAGLSIGTSGTILTARVPRYEAGMLIRIETVDRYFRPEFLGREDLRGRFHCLRRVVSFRAPAGHSFRSALRNGEALPVRADTLASAGAVEIRFSAADLPKRVESRSPQDPGSWYAALHFSVPPRGLRSWTWSELGGHYLEMIGAGAAPESIKTVAAGLGPAQDADSLADRAFRIVKSRIRYLADSRGMHGWVPRAPESVWGNGYGDCKEMANVLRVLLAERGMEGGLALVLSRAGTQLSEEFPSLDAFDHAIYWRRRKDGSIAYLDPTMPAGLGSAASHLRLLGRKTFLISPGGSRIDTIRPAPANASRITSVSRLAQAGGGWELTGSIGMKGAIAADVWLSLYFEPDPQRARNAMESLLAERFRIRARDFSWTLPAADSVEIRYAADGSPMLVDGKFLNLDRPWLFDDGSGAETQEGERRIRPYAQRDEWIVPAGYARLASRPLDAHEASGKWARDGLLARREFAVGKGAWPPGESPEWRNFKASLSRFIVAAACK